MGELSGSVQDDVTNLLLPAKDNRAVDSQRRGQCDCKAMDWDRLMSERETTSAALAAGLQRIASLEHEAKELDQELVSREGTGKGELGGLRSALRRLARPTIAAVSRARPRLFSAPSKLAQSAKNSSERSDV